MVVFVLATDRKPLDPCHPARARQLLRLGRAAVFRRYPFTIILHDRKRAGSVVHEHRLKIDPGSKTTGLAILQGDRVIWAAELTHRGQRIKAALESRRAMRRNRRSRKTRYRQPRFLHRRRPEGWLPPSLWSRVCNVMTWVERLARHCPISTLSQELVRFDTQRRIGHTNGILSPPPLERNPENTPARSPCRRLPQHATAACESGAQQGVVRLSAGWTCRSG